LYASCAIALLLAGAALAWDMTDAWRSGPPALAGQIAVPARNGVALIDPVSGQARDVVKGGNGETITSAAWSPDRSRIAYGVFHRVQGDAVSSGEIYVAASSGGSGEVAVSRDRPGSVADMPRWSADGAYLYYAYQGLDGRVPVARAERLRVADGERAHLYQDASAPDVSPNGQRLVFVHDDMSGPSLMSGSADGGAAVEVVGRGAFTNVFGPRFSPDGARIAFVAQGTGPAAEAGPLGRLAAIFAVPVAYAHGEPWSVWTVRPDGGDLRRASSLTEDEPLLAWSPDGAWLAVHGTGGLWVVATNPTVEPRRIADGSFGALDW